MIEQLFYIKIGISILIIYLIYKWGTIKQNLHLKLNHKGPFALPFIGNMFWIMWMGLHEFDKMCRKRFGHIYPFYLGSIRFSVVSDEELMKQILIKDFKCFTDRLDVGLQTETTEKMLTNLKGKDWERVRNLISPTFTSGKLKKMSPLLAECVKLLSKRLHDSPTDQSIDMKEFFGALTMDAIAQTMFGMKIDSQTNPKNLFIMNAKKLFSISTRNPLLLLMLIFPIFGRLVLKVYPKFEIFGKTTFDFFSQNLEKAIIERKASNEHYTDFLALMLKVGKEDLEGSENDTKYLTSKEIIAQSLIFLIAGYETTATTLVYVSYFLAKNPEIQQQLYDELKDSLGIEEEISYEALMKMPLLDAAINETLRLCPPVVRLDRTCTKDVDLVTSDGSIIKAKIGDVFAIPVYGIHTDPEIWPDPESFDIRRFDQESKKDRSPYAFMPFGMGPRNCVGMRFALLEIKWALVTILKDFEIIQCDQTPKRIKFRKFGLSQPEKPILLKIVKRQ